MTRAAIVNAARMFLGVEFGHQGRARAGDRHARMDCVGILFCTGEDLGLVDREGVPIHRDDSRDYGPQPTDERIQAECKRRLILVEEFGKPPLRSALFSRLVPGEVLTLRVPNVICHAAIVTGGEPNPTMIYALPTALNHDKRRRGRVVETLLGQQWRERVAGVFRFPGVDY